MEEEREEIEETKSKSTEKNVKVGTASKLRRSKKTRVIVIAVLLLIVGVLFFFFEKARIWLVGIAIALLVALGLEVSGNDWDLGKLMQTGSFSESKVEQTEGGWLIDDERCQAENFNCDNFEYQEDAQELFEYCGGLENDVHRLDGDKDGIVCEALPSSE